MDAAAVAPSVCADAGGGVNMHYPTTTRGDVRRLIQRGETAAALLRTPGHTMAARGEREDIAAVLAALAQVARRRLDPEHEPEPEQYHGGEDLITDLFGESAA